MSQDELLVESRAKSVAVQSATTESAETAGKTAGAAAPAGAPPPAAASTTTAPVPEGITLLAIYNFVIGGIFLLGMIGVSIAAAITGIVGLVEDPSVWVATFILGIIMLVLMAFTAFFLAIGYGLRKRRQWARIASIVVAVLSLFFMPVGTIIGGLTVWYLIKPDIVATFEG